MRIKTEIGTTILITFAIIVVVVIIIGQNKISEDLNVIETSMLKNRAVLIE